PHIHLVTFFLHCSVALRDLHSFPTRRSSDLEAYIRDFVEGRARPSEESDGKFKLTNDLRVTRVGRILRKFSLDELLQLECFERRSEEQTSELQSLRHLVCRLLLEKKKNTIMK